MANSLVQTLAGLSLKTKLILAAAGIVVVGAAANQSNSGSGSFAYQRPANFYPSAGTPGPMFIAPSGPVAQVAPALPPMWPDPPSNDAMEAIINGN